ncbi:MAG: carboxypeptidase-like regulatory domain-containing protein [Aureispira sp.]
MFSIQSIPSSLLLFLFFILTGTACQQQNTTITVTGTVSNSSGVLIAGTTVTNSDRSTTVTDANGKYSTPAAMDGTLTFEAEGYIIKTVDVDNQSVIDITLEEDPWVASFVTNNNSIKDPQFPSNSLIPSTTLSAPASTDPWFTAAPYAGAVETAFGNPWYSGWSFFDRIINGNTTSAPINIAGKPTLNINDNWMRAQGTTINWSADTVYILDSLVFVGSGQTLNIAAGTVIQGKAGTAAGASALIITRGAKIMAQGTATAPIIFTYEGDMGNSSVSKRAQWGGLLILGYASLNSSLGKTQIEGIPTNELRGLYGGTNDADNSGVLRYVSIRHGGTTLGSNNEINGLTLGGVGSNTTIEYVEVVSNQDDAIEWFGGTVNAKHLIAAYCGDDGLDYDEGYRGKNQFVIVYQDPTVGDFGGEHDGGTTPQTGTPYSTPKFWNVTSVGSTNSQALIFGDNAGGQYHNSIFINYNKGVSIEDEKRQEQDSYKQFVDGELKITNSVFFNIGNNTSPSDIFFIEYIQ